MWAQFRSEFYWRWGYSSRLKLKIWLENCLDVFTDSHFQVKFWSVLGILLRYVCFINFVVCWPTTQLWSAVFPCYIVGEGIHPGKINQSYFFCLLWPHLLHPGHLLSDFSAHKVPEQQARRSYHVMSVQDKIDKLMEWVNEWSNYLWLGLF